MRLHVLGFDWDERNARKLEVHGLVQADIEWLFDQGKPDVFDHPTRSDRLIALGFVPDGRFVLVAFEYDRATRWVRVVTAYEPDHERWWRIYERSRKRKK